MLLVKYFNWGWVSPQNDLVSAIRDKGELGGKCPHRGPVCLPSLNDLGNLECSNLKRDLCTPLFGWHNQDYGLQGTEISPKVSAGEQKGYIADMESLSAGEDASLPRKDLHSPDNLSNVFQDKLEPRWCWFSDEQDHTCLNMTPYLL